MREVRFKIVGEIPVKKNLYKKTEKGGKSWLYKDSQVGAWEKDAFYQIKEQTGGIHPFAGKVSLSIAFWQKQTKDIDGMITSVMDILEQAGILKNDRQVKHIKDVWVFEPRGGPAAVVSVKTYNPNIFYPKNYYVENTILDVSL